MQNNAQQYAEDEQWVIWNGSLGVLDMVTLGEIEVDGEGRKAWLDEPYEMVGPFSLDELENSGRIYFAACMVMSRQRWQQDQVELRREAIKSRRATQERIFEHNARTQQHWQRQPAQPQPNNEKRHRESLNLPLDGELQVSQIKSAYRRLAQKAHPDVGGSQELFVRITEARDALLDLMA